jgi:hypothetical protein
VFGGAGEELQVYREKTQAGVDVFVARHHPLFRVVPVGIETWERLSGDNMSRFIDGDA